MTHSSLPPSRTQSFTNVRRGWVKHPGLRTGFEQASKIPGFLLTKSSSVWQASREVRRQRGQEQQRTDRGMEGTPAAERALGSQGPGGSQGAGAGFQPQRRIVSFWGYGNKAPQTELLKENRAAWGFWSQGWRSECPQGGVGR